jgi:hypothetical protein
MRRYVFSLAILALATVGTTVARGDDQEIAQQIVQQLQQEKQAGQLKGFAIDLQVEEGTVWMSGRVANADQQAKALDVARRIPGVAQVVNDLSIATDQAAVAVPSPTQSMLQSVSSKVRNAWNRDDDGSQVTPASGEESSDGPRPIGSGVSPTAEVGQPVYTTSPAARPMPINRQNRSTHPSMMPAGVPTPVYAGSTNAVPLAYAPARPVNYQTDEVSGQPMPMHLPGSGVGMAPARYDHPSMPGYAWPSYAAHPNYAAVTYPKQYSPSAWPYIGPFYPYPQVPLGWRKVQLEWDDGWWFLDFRARRYGLSRGR